uniref:NADH-ubiquinone oxidoreductase n=1 Tax=Tanacetum cinerariifolium TaxID=118510 RepID=A0A6L2KGI5_TANCI|nr:NADH-ubiquinone oxidoreductase [Tanacetum cinerariifolium]
MSHISSFSTVEESADEHEIGDEYLTEKEQYQLLLDEEALRETLEEKTRAEKEWEERIRQEQAHDELFRLEFGVQSDSESVFVVIGVVTPITLIVYSFCSDCAKYQIRQFEVEILVSQGVVAAIALFCVSRNLRKYGVRKLLFVDEYDAYAVLYRKLYIQKINGFFRGLAVWLLVCLLLKTAREVTRVVYLHHDSWWLSAAYLIASLVTWAYSAIIILSGTALFNLVGNLQVIRIENYGKILEKDLDVSVYIEEHMRLAHYLSKISHRFRVFLLLEFLVVTGSQFAALLQTTQNKGIINFINTGDFAVLSILELVGIVLCLSAASKISHRAQALGSVACRWHALITCDSNDASQSGTSIDIKNTAVNSMGSLGVNNSESELESDFVPFATHNQFASSTSSYHKRQSFVSYVQSNTGGFTIFGWIIDRMLINTIFFIELSLIFFVLGKTITITLR